MYYYPNICYDVSTVENSGPMDSGGDLFLIIAIAVWSLLAVGILYSYWTYKIGSSKNGWQKDV